MRVKKVSQGYSVSTKVAVRYAETDQMGVVYYANYFVWFEVGRNAYFQRIGYSYKALEEQGLLFPIIEASCRYLVPAQYEDQLIITTQLLSVSASRLSFLYSIFRDETLIATGQTTQAFVNRSTQRPVSLKKHYPKLWECLQKLLAGNSNGVVNNAREDFSG